MSATERSEPVAALVGVLADSLRELADLGRGESASLLAGRAYSALRRERPREAQRINALMHRLARIAASQSPSKESAMSTPEPQLDVRTEPPARRHELIFDTYAELARGHGFVLVNDHDPKPLYYQLAAEHPGEFTWDYLEQGPEVWRVRIGRAPAGEATPVA